MMVAVEKWGCNEIRVSLFFHSASFSHISNRSTLLSLQFLGSAFQYSVGGSARQMRAMGQITKSFCFPSRFYTKCGWHAPTLPLAGVSKPKILLPDPEFLQELFPFLKTEMSCLKGEMIIHQSKLDGNEKFLQKRHLTILQEKIVRWRFWTNISVFRENRA